MEKKFVTTKELKIAYEVSGPENGEPIILLHGWPDCARTWDKVLPLLHQAGFKTIVPSLRGFGETRFIDSQTTRAGGIVAFADDLKQFIEKLGLGSVNIIGQDWGAQTALVLSQMYGKKYLKSQVIISEGINNYQNMSLKQVQNYWYQWYLSTDQGVGYLKQHRNEFAEYMWQLWSPNYQFDKNSTEELESYFTNPDWLDITLNTYRGRWGYAVQTDFYQNLEQKLDDKVKIEVPTLNILGKGDTCTDYRMVQGMGEHFKADFKQGIWDNIGHFVQREDPKRVATAAIQWFQKQ